MLPRGIDASTLLKRPLPAWFALYEVTFVFERGIVERRLTWLGLRMSRRLSPVSATLEHRVDADGGEHGRLVLEGPQGKLELDGRMNQAPAMEAFACWLERRAAISVDRSRAT